MIDQIEILFHLMRAKFGRPRSPKALARIQNRGFKKLATRIKRDFPFYKALIQLPILTKREYVAQFHELNTFRLPFTDAQTLASRDEAKGEIRLGLSTGTSGRRGVFMTSRKERLQWAAQIIARCLPTSLNASIAFFLRADNQLYSAVTNSGSIKLRYFGLDANFDESLKELEALKPDVLVAPPYVLAQIAKSCAPGFRPRTIFSVADILDPFERRAIENRFGGPTREIYQATEGFLGSSCALGRMHLNEDLIYFEKQFLDQERGIFVPVISDFHRHSQAIVRYRLDDVLKLASSPCGCGSPLTALDEIEGRLDEIFFVSAAGPNLTPIYRSEIISALDDGTEVGGDFELKQISLTEFLLSYDDHVSQTWLRDAHAGFRELLASRGVTKMDVKLAGSFSRKLSEKRRRVIREYTPPAGELDGGFVAFFS